MSNTNAAFPDRTVTCWCGCGGRTKSKFVQGHDSKFHSTIKKCIRGVEGFDADVEYLKLPHDAARAEWDAFVEKQLPKEEARNLKLAEQAATQARVAAEKAQAKAIELAAKATPRLEEAEGETAVGQLTA